MSDWAAVAIIGIIAVYKLTTQWIESRDDGYRETDNYSSTETSPHEIRADSERCIPDIRLGFQREERSNDA